MAGLHGKSNKHGVNPIKKHGGPALETHLKVIVQQQRDQIFEVPKPAVQHFSTCLELFSGISRYRIWLMTLPEMGAG